MTNYKSIVFQLGVRTGKESGNRIEVLCPFHFDKSLGSAFINLDAGWLTCYSCKSNKHLYHIVKKLRPSLSHSEIQLMLGWSNKDSLSSIIKAKIEKDSRVKEFKNPPRALQAERIGFKIEKITTKLVFLIPFSISYTVPDAFSGNRIPDGIKILMNNAKKFTVDKISFREKYLMAEHLDTCLTTEEMQVIIQKECDVLKAKYDSLKN